MDTKQISINKTASDKLSSIYKAKPDNDGGIESFFKKVDAAIQKVSKKEPQNTKQDKASMKKTPTDQQQYIKKTSDSSKDSSDVKKYNPVDQSKASSEPDVVKEIVDTKADDDDQLSAKFDEANAQITKEISKILSVSEDDVNKALNSLNLTAMQLNDKSNMNNFLQAVFNKSDQLELLNVPDISKMMKGLEQTLNDYKDLADTNMKNVNADANKTQVANVKTDNVDVAKVITTNAVLNQNDKLADKISKSANEAQDNQDIDSKKDNEQPANEKTTKLVDVKDASVNLLLNSAKPGMKDESLLNSNQQNNSQLVNNLPGNVITEEKVQFANTVAKSISTANVNTQDVVEQIINRMKVEIKGNVTEVKLTLRPENLGDVSLKITTENGIVTAHFLAENQKIKEVIESNFNQLKDSLQQQGVNISSLSVSVGQNPQEKRMQQFIQNQQKSAARINKILNSAEVVDEEDVSSELTSTDVFDNSVEYMA